MMTSESLKAQGKSIKRAALTGSLLRDLLEPRCRATIPSSFDRTGPPPRSMGPRIALQECNTAKNFRGSIRGSVVRVNKDLLGAAVRKLY